MPAHDLIQYVEAEYDTKNHAVVALKSENGEIQGTPNPRVLGNPTSWIPVETVLPVGFDDRFQGLLLKRSDPDTPAMRYSYDEARNVIILDYPQADFSPSAIREALSEQINYAASIALTPTDWFIVRKVETDKEVPSDVREHRSTIRKRVQEFKDKLQQTPDDELSSFTINLEDSPTSPTLPEDPGPAFGGDGKHWITDATEPGVQGNPLRPAAPNEVPEGE